MYNSRALGSNHEEEGSRMVARRSKSQTKNMEAIRKFLSGSSKELPNWSLLSSLSNEEWSGGGEAESLAALFVKTAKKSPEGFSEHACSILRNLPESVACDCLISAGFSLIAVRMLKSGVGGVRNAGIRVVAYLFQHLQQHESLGELLQTLIGALKGKVPGSSIVSILPFEQKLSVLFALHAIAPQVIDMASAPFAENAESLFSTLQKEEDLTLALLTSRIVASWLGRNPELIERFTTTSLLPIIQSSRSIGRKVAISIISNLWRACGTHLLPKAISDFITQSLVAAPVQDGDSLVELSILIMNASANTNSKDSLLVLKSKALASSSIKESITRILAIEQTGDFNHISRAAIAVEFFETEGSFITHIGSSLQLQEHIMASMTILLHQLNDGSEELGTKADLIVGLLLAGFRLRLLKWVKATVADCLQNSALVMLMVKGLLGRANSCGDHFLVPSSEQTMASITTRFRDENLDINEPIEVASNVQAFGKAVKMILKEMLTQSSHSLTLQSSPWIALCCSHPVVCPSFKSALKLWTRISSNCFSHGEVLCDEESAVVIMDAVLSPNRFTRIAAYRAISLISNLYKISSSFLEDLLNRILFMSAQGITEAYNSLSDTDFRRLIENFEAAVESEVELRKAGAEKGTNSTDLAKKKIKDKQKLDWGSRVHSEQSGSTSSSNDSRAEVLAIMSARRTQAFAVIARARYCMEFIAAARISDMTLRLSFALKWFETLDLTRILSCSLLQETALDILNYCLTQSLSSDSRPFVRDLLAARRLVAMHSMASAGEEEVDDSAMQLSHDLPDCILRLFRSLNLLLNNRVAAAETVIVFQIGFPVFYEICLINNIQLSTVEATLSLLLRLWPRDYHYELFVSNGISLCLHSAASFPKVMPLSRELLETIIQNALPLSATSYAPLVGSAGLLHDVDVIRALCAEVLCELAAKGAIDHDSTLLLESSMWVVKHDTNETAKSAASKYLSIRNLALTPEYQKTLISTLAQHLKSMGSSTVKDMIGRSLASILFNLSFEDFDRYLNDMFNDYREAIPIKENPDAKHRGKNKEPEDLHLAVRKALSGLLQQFGSAQVADVGGPLGLNQITKIIDFVLDLGAIDPNSDVRSEMLGASVKLISQYGAPHAAFFPEYFESFLARKASPTESLAEYDIRHSAAVVLLGTAVRHLTADHPSFLRTFQLLIESLNIPSESVQRAVSDCLPPIAQSLKGTEAIDTVMKSMLEKVLNAPMYGERRGAAFGLAALVKGLGIMSLKSYNVVGAMKEACAGGSVSSRQGAMFVIECLAERLGLLFEPYVVGIVDSILSNFSHSSDHVRDASQGAMKVVMTKLSAHGVKQILTPVINTLQSETAWKTRVEAIKTLGTMAQCAPKQISSCLPQIVPCLMQASTDPHPKVKESAKSAMSAISSVIRNPEISKLSGILLAALGDPASKTKDALDALLNCEFMYTIDPPSLALLVPILSRALKDRSGDLKRKSAAITGNMMGMVGEQGALQPYMTTILPGLKDCLIDPIPDVRASGAKALGFLCQSMAAKDSEVTQLMNWLFATLQSEASPVERSGAAQGLAEICGSCNDPSQVSTNIESILSFADANSSAKEGVMWFLAFLPFTLKERFAPYISPSMQAIIQGFRNDGSDNVREVALRAGKVIVSVLGSNHSSRIATILIEGVSANDWKIRISSLQLLGDLIVLVGEAQSSNASGLAQAEGTAEADEEDAITSASPVLVKMRRSFGKDLCDKVLASVYILRADIMIPVRQSALQIWKVAVTNTPKTLVEIMPTLVSILVGNLSSTEEDLRLIAGRSIGELVSKLGDRVLSSIVPLLESGLTSPRDSARLGVCLGLGEVLAACTKKQLEEYMQVVIVVVSKALCDDSAEVCEEAAKAFMTLYRTVGSGAVDVIVPSLLNKCDDQDDPKALVGLRQIVSQRPRDMVDYLLPKLMTENRTKCAAKAICAIAPVSGSYVHFYFDQLLPYFVREMQSLESSSDSGATTELKETLTEAAVAVFGSLSATGILPFVSEVGKLLDGEASAVRRQWGCWLMAQFFKSCRVSYSEFLPVLLKYLLSRVADSEVNVLCALRDCTAELVSSVPLDRVVEHIDFIRNCITSAASSARHKTGGAVLLSADGDFILPLFTIPKGLDPLITIFSFGLTHGSMQVREASADMIAECASIATSEVLKPVLLKVVGSLIRTIGDRSSSAVKSEILKALMVLLKQGGVALKAFAPQLQTTFVKALHDPLREVRHRAVKALGLLLRLGPRIDPLISDLCNLCSQLDSHAIQLSVLEAIGTVLKHSGVKLSGPVAEKCSTELLPMVFATEDLVKLVACRCLGILAPYLSDSRLAELFQDLLRGDEISENREMRYLALACVLQGCGVRGKDHRAQVLEHLAAASRAASTNLAARAALASGLVVLLTLPRQEQNEADAAECKGLAQEAIRRLSPFLAETAASSAPSDLRIRALLAIKQAALAIHGATAQHYEVLFPAVITATKDIDLRVKYAGESAARALLSGQSSKSSAVSAPFQQLQSRLGDNELGRAIKECQRKLALSSDGDGGLDAECSFLLETFDS